ncbi:MAG: DUF3099 domain-containing protein [Microbacteriaceae bacterium]
MKKAPAQSITTLEESPAEERRRRFVRYTIAMSVRMVCFVLLLFVRGWWLLLVASAAIVLPYVAVVIANNGSRRAGSAVERPEQGALVRVDPVVHRPTVVDDGADGEQTDSQRERR